MDQLVRDCIVLGLVGEYIPLDELIEEYEGKNVKVIASELIKTDEQLKSLLKELANDCYNRIKETFPKE